jgi:mannose-6-phosphate isomerase-like protein (cupin superfamily)
VGIPVHVHEREEEILFFHEGSGELEVDGEKFPITPGMSVFLPLNIPHGLRNTGKGPLKLLWIFSPPGYENIFREMAGSEMDHGEIEKHIGPR